ncbi:MAG: MBL fold metallo-hydrolase [Lachnospiraceae bacterium]|nr:MBL fold metallo-hydrolase [Lachnospiraceae bacterium]
MKRWIKALITTIIVIITIIIFVLLILRFWPSFGGQSSSKDEKDYAARSAVFENGKFGDLMGSFSGDEVSYPNTVSDKGATPTDPIPVRKPSFDEADPEDVSITWMGHSTVLIQMSGKNILIDPIFSDRSSPVGFAGPKRFSEPPVTFEELPKLDYILITHDHFDHLDMAAIKQLDEKTDRFLVPLGIENDLERWGVPADKIIAVAWWESEKTDDLEIVCAPSKHYSMRNMMDRNETLWCSWIFVNDSCRIYDTGDTGYGDHFKEIYKRYGSFDLVLSDGAQYNSQWANVHMFPEQEAQAMEDMHSTVVWPVHWAAYSLAPHAWDDPAERIVTAGEEKGLDVVTPYIGETVKLSEISDHKERWWKDIR